MTGWRVANRAIYGIMAAPLTGRASDLRRPCDGCGTAARAGGGDGRAAPQSVINKPETQNDEIRHFKVVN
ncbi:hypothetical protein GCM10009779_36190 [Polymorphospora rubra]